MNNATSVVIVDENASFIQTFCHYLGGLPSFQISGTAGNLNEAYNLILKKQPEAVLFDLQMPEAQTLTLVSMLNAEKSLKRPCYFMMGAEGIESVLQHAHSLGVAYCMIKPFNFEVAAERIHSLSKYKTQDYYAENYKHRAPLSSVQSQLETKLNGVLYSMGLTPNIQGFQYLKDSVLLTFNYGAFEIKKASSIYCALASRYHTTPARVERAIHYAKVLAARKNFNKCKSIFDQCACKRPHSLPTNLVLIRAISKQVY